MLNGSLSVDKVASHTECRLGKWYYGDESKPYRSHYSFKAIEKPHLQIHSTIDELVKEFNKGNVERALELNEEVKILSNQIITNLDHFLAEI